MKKHLITIAVMTFLVPNTFAQNSDLIPLPAKVEMLSGTYELRQGLKGIRKTLDPHMDNEAYTLHIDRKGVKVKGGKAGLFYAMQTLKQLAYNRDGEALTLPCIDINDKPRFKYRGLLLDVARIYQRPEFIKKLIDQMAYYKLNVLHLHLTEDAGWRIEIKSHPELTRYGAWRTSTQIGPDGDNQDNLPHGGYYTQAELRDLVKYAEARQVTIIPEIDMPGHMMAALCSHPELSCTGGPFTIPLTWGVKKDILCAGNETTYTLLEDVLKEVMQVFPSRYIHLGGDEAPKDRWNKCPKCQELIRKEGLKDANALQGYFMRRIEKMVNAHGRHIIGWDETLEGGISEDATIMSWRGERGGIAAANSGHDVIMAPTDYFYFDYYQSDDRGSEPLAASWGATVDLRKTYSYEPASSSIPADKLKHIIGVQACLWGEKVQTERMVEYMAYPRILALAELAWSERGRRNYSDFQKRLSFQLLHLDSSGVAFRIPEAGIKQNTSQGAAILTLTPSVKNAEIYYATDGKSPYDHGKLLKNGSVTIPLTLHGTEFKYIIKLPSGRNSGIYKY